MSPSQSLRKRIFTIGGPALGVLLTYNFVFYGPLQRTLRSERSKLHKIQIASARSVNTQLNAQKLASLEGEIQSLNKQISDSKQNGSHLVALRAEMRSEFLQSTSPAMVMAKTLSLLSQHNLECIDSSPVVVQDHSASVSAALKPVAALLMPPAEPSGKTSDNVDSIDRREMRITLRGRFQDVQSALREMQAAPLGIFTVSLEMEDSNVRTDTRIWILTIAV